MAGHSIIINGSRCFIDYADATGEAIVNGRLWRWEFHHFCGPMWLKKDGEPRACQNPTSKAVWAAFDKWHKKYEQRKKKIKQK